MSGSCLPLICSVAYNAANRRSHCSSLTSIVTLTVFEFPNVRFMVLARLPDIPRDLNFSYYSNLRISIPFLSPGVRSLKRILFSGFSVFPSTFGYISLTNDP